MVCRHSGRDSRNWGCRASGDYGGRHEQRWDQGHMRRASVSKGGATPAATHCRRMLHGSRGTIRICVVGLQEQSHPGLDRFRVSSGFGTRMTLASREFPGADSQLGNNPRP